MVILLEAQTIIRVVSLFTASVILVFGIIVLTGTMIPASVPETYRIVLGIVIVLYALYRIVFLWMKQRHARSNEE